MSDAGKDATLRRLLVPTGFFSLTRRQHVLLGITFIGLSLATAVGSWFWLTVAAWLRRGLTARSAAAIALPSAAESTMTQRGSADERIDTKECA